jgi:hypothetical protein
MSANQSRARSTLIKTAASTCFVIGASLTLFFGIDFLAGARIREFINPHRDHFRVSHPTYHHDLKPNFSGVGYWGTWTYPVCTDGSGFKSGCVRVGLKQKSFDVAFIGDSFTEGIGLPYEKTFVGMVANQLPNLTIANLGVVSYSPAIYLSKLTYLFSQGYRFKHIIVFIDIGDVYDEANEYDLYENQFVVAKGETYPFSWFKQARRWAIRHFPLTAMGWDRLRQFSVQRPQVIHNVSAATITAAVEQIGGNGASASRDLGPRVATSDSEATQASFSRNPLVQSDLKEAAARNIYEGIYERNYPKSEWTYNTKSLHYGQGGVQNTLEKMRREMSQLVSMATSYGATVSIGVYPWPGQLKFDAMNSLQVRFWKDFCTDKCLRFYDVFPEFFQLADEKGTQRIIDDYYFSGDVHFTEQGNKVIADAILKQGIGAR